jgi:hypothetical protein
MLVLFTAILKPETFREVILGRAGEAARQTLIADCKKLYSAAGADLPGLTLRFTHDQPDPDILSLFSIEFCGGRDWTQYEVLLLDAIAISLDDLELQQSFLELLDLTQWTLRANTEETAKQSGISINKIWAIVVGQLGMFASKQPPFLRITASLRQSLMRARRQVKFCLQDQLWTRVNRDPADHFSLAILLDCLTYCQPDSRPIDLYITVARLAWESRIYHLRLNALHFLQSIRWGMHELQPAEIQMIRELLAQFETRNLFLNSSLLELQAVYGVLEPPVSVDQAFAEMEAVIAEFAPGIKSNVGPELCNRAYGLLSNIFEDIYQGAYNEAYESLGPGDKPTLLALAAQSDHAGISTNWILTELLKYGGESALPVFKQFASSIDGDSNSPQEAAVAYALGVQGCAQSMNEPPMYTGPDTPGHRAWQIIGNILFWVFRSRREPELPKNRIEALWNRLAAGEALAAVDVLYSLHNGLGLIYTEAANEFDLVTHYPAEVKRILEHGLKNRSSLTSVFSCFSRGGNRNESLALFVINELGRIGNGSTIPLLQEVSDDSRLGADAIAAIRSIRESARGSHINS